MPRRKISLKGILVGAILGGVVWDLGKNLFGWYVTNLVKWPTLDVQSDTLPTAHKKDCHVLLEQELRLPPAVLTAR